MKGLIYSFSLSMILAIAAGDAGAQDYNLAPDGSYVGGDSEQYRETYSGKS